MGHQEVPAPRQRTQVLAMKKILKTTGIFGALVLGIFSLQAHKAEAANLLLTQDQMDGSTLTSGNGFFVPYDQGGGISLLQGKQIEAITLSVCAFRENMNVKIVQGSFESAFTNVIIPNCESGPQIVNFNLNSPVAVSATSSMVLISIQFGSGSGDNSIRTSDFSGLTWSGNKEPYILIYGQDIQSTDTHILYPYASPTANEITASTTVNFHWQYYFNCNQSFGILDTAAIDITDVTVGSSTIRFGNQSIGICGTGTFDISQSLEFGHQYLWRPVLYSSTGSSTQIIGSYQNFFVATSSFDGIEFNPATPMPNFNASSTLSNSNILSFLNVPTLLSTKVPFAYIFQIASGIQTGTGSSTAAAIPVGTFTWHNVQGGTTTFDFFSTSTIAVYFTPTLIGYWRAFELVCLTVGFGYALYERAKSKHLI